MVWLQLGRYYILQFQTKVREDFTIMEKALTFFVWSFTISPLAASLLGRSSRMCRNVLRDRPDIVTIVRSDGRPGAAAAQTRKNEHKTKLFADEIVS